MSERSSERLPFEIDARSEPHLVTAHAGVPLVIELVRRVGAAQGIHAQVRLNQRQRGVTSAPLVETLIAVGTAGGDRGQDLTTLRADAARAPVMGDALPTATTLRDCLEGFPVERRPRCGVLVRRRRCPRSRRPWRASGPPHAPPRPATRDVDATILEPPTHTATMPDEGTRGSQSVLVVWAEQALVVHDEFREGNVPAGCGTVRVLARAVASLPGGLTQIFVRGGIAPWMHQRGSPGVSSQSGGAGRPSVPTGVRTCEPRSRGYRGAPGSQTVTTPT